VYKYFRVSESKSVLNWTFVSYSVKNPIPRKNNCSKLCLCKDKLRCPLDECFYTVYCHTG